jgi:hypothetical protein
LEDAVVALSRNNAGRALMMRPAQSAFFEAGAV